MRGENDEEEVDRGREHVYSAEGGGEEGSLGL